MEKRQAVEFLEYLRQDRNLEKTIYGDALNMAIEALKAQLSQQGTTKDTISRQAANDLISRQALCEYALNQKDKSVTPNDIMRFPSVQPEPHEGYWIEGGIYRDVIECYCSECGQLMTTAAIVRMNYCPNCGAKMRGEQHETD